MNPCQSLAAVILFSVMPLVAHSQDGAAGGRAAADAQADAAPPARPANNSARQGIGNDAARAKQGIKSTAREIKEGVKSAARQVKQDVKSGAREVKRGLAVAQCNDGEYSYTHHKTCNHHGGVREKLR
jgi:hypothetical protein